MKLNSKDLLLYAVTDSRWTSEDETLVMQVEKAIQGGATFIQLREKHLDEEAFIKLAFECKAVCQKYHVPFVINDNVDVCLKVDADGVHVGQEDMACQKARELLGDDKIIGVTAHNVEEALIAQQAGADYLGVGAVFGSTSKENTIKMSHETLVSITDAIDIPIVAIGGINEVNVTELKDTGIDGVAVISAIFAKEDIFNSTKQLRKIVEETLC